jgi:hypothetical protein
MVMSVTYYQIIQTFIMTRMTSPSPSEGARSRYQGSRCLLMVPSESVADSDVGLPLSEVRQRGAAAAAAAAALAVQVTVTFKLRPSYCHGIMMIAVHGWGGAISSDCDTGGVTRRSPSRTAPDSLSGLSAAARGVRVSRSRRPGPAART